jgi:transcriptional regulator with XRE-family HTH domain
LRQSSFDNNFIGMTPDQSAMARAALHISRAELAALAGLGVATIVRFEAGSPTTDQTAETLRETLERQGVEFIPAGAVIREGKGASGPGVRLRA